MRLVPRESSKNEPRDELERLVTRLVSSLRSMSALRAHRRCDDGRAGAVGAETLPVATTARETAAAASATSSKW